jgi:hypothetical protein
MDHQIQDNINIRIAVSERTKTVTFNETGVPHDGLERLYRAVESLDMADLKDSIVAPGDLNQFVGLSRKLRNRFLYQDVHPALQELLGDGIVQQGRDRHADGVYPFHELAVIATQPDPLPYPNLL